MAITINVTTAVTASDICNNGMEMVFYNTPSNLAEPLATILLVSGICNNGMEMVFYNTPSNLAAPLTAIL
jgi:hypothetical protein